MQHPIHRIASVAVIGPFTLRIVFEDKTVQVIDLQPVLEGELFGPLQDATLFARVTVDAQSGTVVWPNGADFDPATLHDWPKQKEKLAALASRWRQHAPARKLPMMAAEKRQEYRSHIAPRTVGSAIKAEN